MRYFSENIFTFQPSGENAFGSSPMRFSFDETGRAKSVVIDYFDATGQGRFIRA
jgi:hypothetical protein